MQGEKLFAAIRWWRFADDIACWLWRFSIGALAILIVAAGLSWWECWDWMWRLWYGGTSLAALATLVYTWWKRPGDAAIAARLDRRFQLDNRLESAVELRDGDNPIRLRQLHQARAAWEAVDKRRKRSLYLPLATGIVTLAFWLLCAEFCRTQWTQAQERERVAQAAIADTPAAETTAPTEPEAQPEARIEASLQLDYPTGETEFMPIDLIEWEGAALGDATWRGLEMRVLHNGKPLPPMVLTVPEAAGEAGKRFLGGTVALDELEAAPNDLICLQLTGVIDAGRERRVFSAPVLLRLKPLRDELRIVDIPSGGAGAPFRDFHAYIMEMIRRQSELLRLFFSGRGEWELNSDGAGVLEMFAMLTEEQDKLRTELAAYLIEAGEEEGPGALSVQMHQELTRAIDEMKEATLRLREIAVESERPTALEAAPAAQQRAVAALNAALQELTKVIRKQRDEPSQGAPSSGAKEESNVLEQLDLAIRSQSDLIAAFRTAGIQPEQKEKQGAVTVILQALHLRLELSEATLAALAAAQGASEQAELAIQSNALRSLEAHTQESLKQMKEARRLIEKWNSERRGEALGAARRALGAAQRENRCEENSDAEAAAKSAEKLKEGSRALSEAANEMTGKGSAADIESLRELAKKLEETAGKLPGLERGEAGAAMEQLRRELKAAQGTSGGVSAAELGEKLDRLRREAAYLAKHPEAESKGWLEELALQIEELEDYLDAVDPAHAQPETMQLHQQLAGIPNQLDGWFYAGMEPGDYAGMAERLGALGHALTALQIADKLPTEMFMFAPDQIPEEYRELAAAYFETLSRRNEKNKKNDLKIK